MRLVKRLAWILLAVAFCASAREPLKLLTRSHAVLADLRLSDGEWRWLRAHKTLRLAVWLPMSPPHDITSGLNDYGGINADFLGLAAENLGVDIRVLRYDSYAAALAALRAGEADFIAQASGPARDEPLLLSLPYSPGVPVEVVNRDTIRQPEVRQIAVAPGLDAQQMAQRYPRAAVVSFSSPRHALEALAFRQIDRFFCDAVTARYLISQSSISNLAIRPLDPPPAVSGFAFAALPQMATWIAILNKMLKALPESVSVEIHRRWSGGIPLSLSEQKPVYTPLERKWIREHKQIRVAVAEDNPPVAFFDDGGALRGIIPGILTALQLRTGFTFHIQRYPTQRAALSAVKNGNADLVAGVTQQDIWQADLLTTRTWLYNSWVMVGHPRQAPGAPTPDVISLDGQSPEAWLRKQTGRQPDRVDTWRNGLNRVVRRPNEMLAMPLIVANRLLDNPAWASLRIVGSIDSDPMRFAFGASRQVWPLVTILNKALINIPPEDLHALTRTNHADAAFNASPPLHLSPGLLALTLSALLLTAFAAAWYDRRQRRHRQRLQALVNRLRRSRTRARRTARTTRAFLTTMSHEIRTPISAIVGLLELVLTRPADSAQHRELLHTAQASADSLLQLTGQILDVSRIESGRLILRPERASLRRLIEEAGMMFEGMAAKKGLTFTLELDAGIRHDVLVDRGRFRQILVNLTGNAIKFTPSGQVILRARLENRPARELELLIEIEDSGPGIDDATRRRLFTPFAQGENSDAAEGSGLGLYISQTLATMMQGHIDLFSEPGKGTRATVRLRLPVMDALPAPTAEPPSCRVPPAPCTVMVVDDNPAGRMLLVRQLEWLGHRVISADSAAAALQALTHQQPDALIIDCHMPQMNGFALAQLIRQRHPDLPLFGATADARESVREKGRRAGMNDCLIKPLTLSLLTDLLAPIRPALAWSPADNLPPALLEGDNLRLFLSLQLAVLEESLPVLQQQGHAPGQTLKATLHKLRGGLQLLGLPALEAACLQQERSPDRDGMNSLLQALIQLRETLLRWRDRPAPAGRPTNNEDASESF